MIFYILVLIILLGIFLAKNFNTLKKHEFISTAIFWHNITAISEHRSEDCIDYDVMESYEKTLFRVWDWGYKNIVPPDVLEKISPFINKKGFSNE